MSLIETNLVRLARKTGETHQEISKQVRIAENCGWVETSANSIGMIRDIKLTDSGWAMIGGKPAWMER